MPCSRCAAMTPAWWRRRRKRSSAFLGCALGRDGTEYLGHAASGAVREAIMAAPGIVAEAERAVRGTGGQDQRDRQGSDRKPGPGIFDVQHGGGPFSRQTYSAMRYENAKKFNAP